MRMSSSGSQETPQMCHECSSEKKKKEKLCVLDGVKEKEKKKQAKLHVMGILQNYMHRFGGLLSL